MAVGENFGNKVMDLVRSGGKVSREDIKDLVLQVSKGGYFASYMT